MTDDFASIDEVLQRRKANAGSDWPSRGAANRLEPECWPILSPSFSIAPGARVFGIGSCFARNIELHLARLGFDVPNVRAIADHPDQFAEYGAETLNKYTPVSILEELSWTAAILDRDDVVRADDITPLLLDLGGDRYIDLRTRINPGTGQTLESHVARRQLIHSLNRAAFDCDLAVVTLGLIETWWDTHTGKSIEFHPQLLRQPNRDRFGFRRLSFDEALDATQASIDLLRRDPARRILLTTSPVPLGKTFTSDDVIVANGFSKAMLRTVAGIVAEQSAGVDYFPSYESVMLTKADHVWNDDLIHVDSSFVGKVIARVIESYVGADPAIAAYQRRLRFAECVAAADWSGAESLYDEGEPGAVLSVEHQLDLAAYEIATGACDRAIARLRGLSMGQAEVLDHVRRAHLWRRLGVIDAAASACDDAFAAIARNAVQTRSIIGRVRAMGWHAEALHLAQRAEATFATDPLVLHFLARVQREDGDLAAHDRLTRAALLHDPDSDAHLAFSKELGSRGDPLGAATVLIAFDPDLQRADFFRRVVPLLTTAGEHDRLIELLLHRIECGLDDAATREALARALGQLERYEESVIHARKAAILAPERADLRKLERRLGASASAPVGR